jgi:MOSC domain-containing protein YiiM
MEPETVLTVFPVRLNRPTGRKGIMKLLSVNVGGLHQIVHRGKTVHTGIYKEPVAGPVRLGALNLDGDGQADLRVHGGVHRAVYAYPFEHYEWWRRELGRADFVYGQFGENFTVTGLLEDDVWIGDVLQIGSARAQVSQPRSPCFKLGIRMNDESVPARFNAAQRCGFYLRVLEEGTVTAGDTIARVSRGDGGMSVRQIYALRHGGDANRAAIARAAALPSLTPGWREAFEKMLGDTTAPR